LLACAPIVALLAKAEQTNARSDNLNNYAAIEQVRDEPTPPQFAWGQNQ
jgi:hypothetical protein